MEEISLATWRFNLKRYGAKHWLIFYTALLNQNVSSVPRLYKARKLYGDWALFEAIVSASSRELEGDKLGYVLKVAHNKWKEAEEELDASEEYEENIEKAKLESRRHSDELQKKLEKARRLK